MARFSYRGEACGKLLYPVALFYFALLYWHSVAGWLVGCSKYSLYEVTVHDGVVKQRRLPEQLNNLADRCSFFSRFHTVNTSLISNLPNEYYYYYYYETSKIIVS